MVIGHEIKAPSKATTLPNGYNGVSGLSAVEDAMKNYGVEGMNIPVSDPHYNAPEELEDNEAPLFDSDPEAQADEEIEEREREDASPHRPYVE